MIIIEIITVAILSTCTYLFLHKKTKISLKYLYQDNLATIILSSILLWTCQYTFKFNIVLIWLFIPVLVFGLSFGFTMIRFWRTPKRKLHANDNQIVSPADGNVLYVKRIEKGEVPIAIKKGLEASLDEVTQTKILNTPCWLIGINMTPFDVHKNCAPIEGKIILNKHIDGKFLSLKHPEALILNERNTIVIQGDNYSVGVVQTASRLVRRIDSYVNEGENIKKGDWFGMIRFGSQVDVILPANFKVNVVVGEQIYAKKTIIAEQ